jgi:hypothetical protein
MMMEGGELGERLLFIGRLFIGRLSISMEKEEGKSRFK